MTGAGTASAAVTRLTGIPAIDAEPLGGGCIAATSRVRLAGGGQVVAKAAGDALPGAVAAEAAGLRWLADPGVAAVPAVRGQDDVWLVIDYVSPGRPTPLAAERFGRDLAALHRSGAPAHGAAAPGGPADAWIGRAPMRNEPAPDWPAFYAAHRLEPYLRSAADAGSLTPAETGLVRRALAAVPDAAGPPEPPSRLHGDLWSGNLLFGADGRVWLLDPAAHGGHRETDLAMLRLFSAPYLDRILDAYHEVAPLADGWLDRVPLHQLYPLLVHVVHFGRSYSAQTVAAAKAVLAAR